MGVTNEKRREIASTLDSLADRWDGPRARLLRDYELPKLPPKVRAEVEALMDDGRHRQAAKVVREASLVTAGDVVWWALPIVFTAGMLGLAAWTWWGGADGDGAADGPPVCDLASILACHRAAAEVGHVSGHVTLAVEGGRVVGVSAQSGAGEAIDRCLEERIDRDVPTDGEGLVLYRCAYLGEYGPSSVELSTDVSEQRPVAACEAGDADACLAWARAVEASDPETARRAYQRGCEAGSAAACVPAGRLAYPDDPDAAADAWRSACDGGHAPACARAAEILLAGDDAAAEAVARAGCDAEDAASCASLSLALHRRGEREEALAIARRACAADAPLGCARHAWLLLLDGQRDDALDDAREAVSHRDAPPAARRILGHALVARGDVDEAIRAYARAVESASEGEARAIAAQLGELREAQPDWSAPVDAALERRAEWE